MILVHAFTHFEKGISDFRLYEILAFGIVISRPKRMALLYPHAQSTSQSYYPHKAFNNAIRIKFPSLFVMYISTSKPCIELLLQSRNSSSFGTIAGNPGMINHCLIYFRMSSRSTVVL